MGVGGMGYCLREWDPTTPVPGSPAAMDQGCQCDVPENEKLRSQQGTKFWQRQGCPVHWDKPGPGEYAGLCPGDPVPGGVQ